MARDESPQCETCTFFKSNAPNQRHCNQHDFVMPRADWYMVCGDWQHDGESSPLVADCETGALYYYTRDGSRMQAQLLGRFEQLQRLITSVRVRYDTEYGWIIDPRRAADLFPQPGERLTIQLHQQPFTFEAIQVERALAVSGNAGGISHSVYLLYGVNEPDLLFHWANLFLDMEAYITGKFAPSVFAFAEVIAPGQTYALHPDMLTYSAFARQQ